MRTPPDVIWESLKAYQRPNTCKSNKDKKQRSKIEHLEKEIKQIEKRITNVKIEKCNKKNMYE